MGLEIGESDALIRSLSQQLGADRRQPASTRLQAAPMAV